MAKIIVQEEGCARASEIAGVAAGYNDSGVLIVEDVGLDQLGAAARRRLVHHRSVVDHCRRHEGH